MKKGFLAFVMLSIACGYIGMSACNQAEKAATPTTASSSTPSDSLLASIERGKYLAYHVTGCMDCHSRRDMTRYGGPVVPGTEGMGGEMFGPLVGLPGEVYAPNITPAALKDWTDAEIIRSMTEGINKKGDTLFPLMPYMSFSQMPYADLLDIVHFIRTLPAKENAVPARKLFIPIAAAVPPHPKPDLEKNTKPPTTDPLKYGEYLVRIASCSDCHTPMVQGAPDFSRFMAGGRSFSDGKFTVVSANITQDTLHGIGKWTEEMFLEKFAASAEKAHHADPPGANNTYMPWALFAGMQKDDLRAIYAYLKTVKPVGQAIEKWPPVREGKKTKA